MSIKKTSIAITSAVLIALTSVSAQAAKVSAAQKTTKEQKIGMASGTIAGALIGGPFGAGVGFIVGTMFGAGAGEMNKAKVEAQEEAQVAKAELAAAQVALAELAATQASVKVAAASDATATESKQPTLEQLAQQLKADVLFRTASAELDASAMQKLNELGAVLAKYPSLSIDIDGYADPRGKATENLELSQQRASAVRAALIVGGATPESIRVVAHGEQLSTAAKDDTEAYAWERRATLSVTSSPPSALAQAK